MKQFEFIELAPVDFALPGVINATQQRMFHVEQWVADIEARRRKISPRRMELWKLKQAAKIVVS